MVTRSSEWVFARDWVCIQRHPPARSLAWKDRQLRSLGVVSACQGLGKVPVNLKVWVYPELRVAGNVSLDKLGGATGVENSNRDQMFRGRNVEGLSGAQSGCVQ